MMSMRIYRHFLLGLALWTMISSLAGQTRGKPVPDPTPYTDGLTFRELGPYRGGRSCAVAGIPGKPNLFYFGATGGGVWKTTDGGRSWKNISDGFFGGSIGAIAVAASDPNVLYAGGGEKTVRGNVSFGYGVWRSEDAGRTWQKAGLDSSRHIARLRIHPRDPMVVFAAVMGDLYRPGPERGVYKSTDGGRHWRKVLFASDEAGAVDLCMDPTNPRILYASTWNVRRSPHHFSSGGPGSGLWKSTDSGETWIEITRHKGLPADTIGIIGIAVSPVRPDRIWVILESQSGGVFRSDDGGQTWTKTNSDRNLRQRAWYYTRIYADPVDADKVYVVNVAYHLSRDGGKTFSSHYAPHGDHHDLWIAPEDPRRMIIGDDGGAQVTYDGGETWTTYHNQPTAQFYRVVTDDHFPFRIYAAQQDNTTIRIQHRSFEGAITERHWEETAGCECGHIAPKPDDPEIVFGGCYGGFIQRLDHRTGLSRVVSVWPDNPMGHGVEGMRYRFQWNFPILFSRHDPDVLYAGSHVLHRSRDQGESWEVISPDLTRNDSTRMGPSGGPITRDNTSVEYYCTLFAIAESPRTQGVLWAGSDDGLVWVRKGEGAPWQNVTPPDLPEWAQINALEPDPHDPAGCYVAATRYKSGDYRPYLYRTRDYGHTWTAITTGIDMEHFTRVVRADPDRQGLLFAGTESGLYVSVDDGGRWHPFQQNLPVVPVTDLTLKDGALIVATQGRGLWIMDDLAPLRIPGLVKDRVGLTLFPPRDVYRVPGSATLSPPGAGTNHPAGLKAHFHVPKDWEKDTFDFQVLDTQGEVIRSWGTHRNPKEEKLEVTSGANHFSWDLQYPPSQGFEGMILWWATLDGPVALPGTYSLRIIHSTDTLIRQFRVLPDPRIPHDTVALQDQFRFLSEVNAKVGEAHRALGEIREIRQQMHQWMARYEPDSLSDTLKNLAGRIDSTMTHVEMRLYQTKNESPQDPLNFPIRLTNKLAHLNSLMRQGPYRPTRQAVEVRDALVRDINASLADWDTVRTGDLVRFNRQIREEGLDVIRVKPKP